MAEKLNERGLNVYLSARMLELLWLLFLLRQWQLSPGEFAYYFGLTLTLMVYFSIRRFPARGGQEQHWGPIRYVLLIFFFALQCLVVYLNDEGAVMKIAFVLIETALTAIAGVPKKITDILKTLTGN